MANKSSAENKFEPELIKARQESLQQFISAVGFHEELRSSEPFSAFIQLSEQDFAKQKKEIEKRSQGSNCPNAVLASATIAKRHFTSKNPLDITKTSTLSGVGQCEFSENMSTYAACLKTYLKEVNVPFEK